MNAITWPTKTGTTSSGMKDPKNWRDEEILIPHEGLRWLDRQLLAMIDKFDPHAQPSTAWKTDMLFDWIEKYWQVCIFEYHDKKVTIYNPFLKSHGAVMDDKIFGDRDELLAAIKKTATYRKAVKASLQGLAEFKKHVKDLTKELHDHLAEEEVAYPKALAGVTQEEEKREVLKIIKALGLGGNKAFLPILIYTQCSWKGQERAFEWLQQETPLMIRVIFRNFWLPNFRDKNLGTISAIIDGKKPDRAGCGPCC